MAVAYQTHDYITGNAVNTLNTNVTVAGADRVIVVSVVSNGAVVSTVSGGGASWAAVSGANADNAGKVSTIWRGIAPTTGSQTITVTFDTADGNALAVSTVQYTGADQTTPCQNGTGATGTDDTPTVTVSGTTADDFVQDACQHGNISAAGANQTARGTITSGYGIGSTQDGADGGVMSWTTPEALAWSIAACRIVAAAAAPTNDALIVIRKA